MGVLIGKNRRNRRREKETTAVLADQVLHPLVISLDARSDAGIRMHSFQRAVTQEIQLQIIKAVGLEIPHVIRSHLFEAWMSWIDRDAAIEGLRCAVGGAQVSVAPFVSAASGHETV